jgi:hypothetical protein
MSCIRQGHWKTVKSASRRPQIRQSKSVSFLDLPGEIRNKVYDLLFAGHVLIHRSHPVRERREYPEAKPRFHLESRRIYLSPTDTPFNIEPNLLRVCCQVRDEAVTFLYANTTFRLESVFTMNKFLNVVPAIRAIKKLELRHSTYGEPRLTEDRKWKHQHDKKWLKTCKRIAEQMTALEHLKLELRICDWPTQLNLAAAWAKPLLELKGSKGIDHVEVTLIHYAFNEQRLQATANVVARAMMTEDGRVRHELADDVARMDKLKLRGGLKPVTTPISAKNKALATVLDREKFVPPKHK